MMAHVIQGQTPHQFRNDCRLSTHELYWQNELGQWGWHSHALNYRLKLKINERIVAGESLESLEFPFFMRNGVTGERNRYMISFAEGVQIWQTPTGENIRKHPLWFQDRDSTREWEYMQFVAVLENTINASERQPSSILYRTGKIISPAELGELQDYECRNCFQPYDSDMVNVAVIDKCRHVMCTDCVNIALAEAGCRASGEPRCPQCHCVFEQPDVLRVATHTDRERDR